jgi:phosphate transport system substrate-binding protein
MVHLVTDWAEAYMKAHPGAQLAVTGGGSGTGIAALLNKTTDICMASRPLDEKEKSKAAELKIQPVEHTVGNDGIAIVVNPASTLKEISTDQLKDIYTGKTKDWKDLGAAAHGIIALSRESSSGTYAFFQEHVLKKQDYAPSVRLMPATSAILQAVAEDKTAIGYVGLGYAVKDPKVRILNVKMGSSAAVAPSETTVRSREYPISRPLYLYTTQESSETAKAFVEFCMSAEGQKILREAGYVPLTDNKGV